ncbi:NINE protein [Aquihabitans sp. McL0605]|uniref:NINE protein n=1 Tax=Aquihabitans sp. McL0605 TaxID=3415671 RepID=UPI003CF3611A
MATDNLWYPPEALPVQVAPAPQAAITTVQQAVRPPAPQTYAPAPAGQFVPGQPKSKLGAGLLALFLGTLGIHRFYLGYTGLGLTMLLLTILSFGLLLPITAIWALVEAILIFTGRIKDSNGQPLA